MLHWNNFIQWYTCLHFIFFLFSVLFLFLFFPLYSSSSWSSSSSSSSSPFLCCLYSCALLWMLHMYWLVSFGVRYTCWCRYWYWYWDWYLYVYLTTIELTRGGSSTVHIYTQTIHRTTQLTTLVGRLSGIWTQSGILLCYWSHQRNWTAWTVWTPFKISWQYVHSLTCFIFCTVVYCTCIITHQKCLVQCRRYCVSRLMR
jgi:hypothetical protein